MQELFQRITSLLPDPEWSFVFPSEITARFWRHAVVSRGIADAVWADRFLSWDRFKEIAFGLRESRRPVNGIIRRLFAIRLAEEHRRTPFFVRLLPGSADPSAGSIRELSRILPRIHSLVPEITTRNWHLAEDLRALQHRYDQFLTANGLYEPSQLTPSLEKITARFLLCFPESLEDFPQYRPWLENHPAIEFLNPSPPADAAIDVYPNERLEVSALFRRIRSLLLEGTPPQEIVITLPEIEKNRRYLEEAAYRFDIPLQFRTGKPLTEYASVRFFRSLQEVAGNSFEIEACRNLFLNAAVPWKDSRNLRRLINEGISTYVIRNWRDRDGSHGWEEQLSRGGCGESLALYRRLSAGIRQVTSAKSFSDVAVRLQAFIGAFLETRYWNEEAPTQLKAFQRALEILNDFARTEEEYPELKPPAPFSVWISALEENNYVEQQPDTGIRVYPYRASAGIDTHYHFMPFLTQDSSRVVWDRGFPLNEAQREETGITDEDVSDIYLHLYLRSGTKVLPSCSETGYSGPGLPPGLFVDSGGDRKITEDPDADEADPNSAEENFFRSDEIFHTPPLSWQQEGYERFYAAGARSRNGDIMETVLSHAGLIQVLRDRYYESRRDSAVSPTDLDAFWNCPFAFLFESVLGVEEDEYAPVTRDHRLEGILLHSVLEEFSNSLKHGRFLSAEVEEYRETIRRLLHTAAKEHRGPLPLRPSWEASLAALEKQLIQFPDAEAALFDGFATAGTERTLSAEVDGIPARGRIDRVSRGPGGELLVVDYKKGFRLQKSDLNAENGTPATMQIPFYVLLLTAAGLHRPGDDLISAYYVASEGKYRVVSSSVPLGRVKPALTQEKFDTLLTVTRQHIAEMGRRIAAGDYRTSPEECAGCALRALCRGRYVVR